MLQRVIYHYMICTGMFGKRERERGRGRGVLRAARARCHERLHHMEVLEIHLGDDYRWSIHPRCRHSGAEDRARGD